MKLPKKLLSLLLCAVMVLGSVAIGGNGFAEVFDAFSLKASAYSTGDYIYYGTYPQSKVTDSALVSALNGAGGSWKSYGYYSGTGGDNDGQMTPSNYMRYTDVMYSGTKYRGVIFDSYRPYYTGYTCSSDNSSQDDNGYTTGNVYWFKYEPIKWRVIDPSTGLIMCDTAIDSQAYNNYLWYGVGSLSSSSKRYGDEAHTYYASNYAKSSIRAWLNKDFYNTAFSSDQKSNIVSTTLDNSSTYSSAYDAPSTTDKIFLLSYNDSINSNYGFSSSDSDYDTARQLKSTDYAKCQGCHQNTSDSYRGNCCWWLRSPYDSDCARAIYSDGYSGYLYFVCSTFIGVVPALRLSNLKSDYAGSEIGSGDSIELLNVPFYIDGTTNQYVTTSWDWSDFSNDNSAYSQRLAMNGLLLSKASETAQSRVENIMQNHFGFNKIVSKDYKSDDLFSPGITFGYKEYNGNIIVAAVIRGSTSVGDWATDALSQFIISDGFLIAYEEKTLDLIKYIENIYCGPGVTLDYSKVKVYITGHSYGAAVAQGMAMSLPNKGISADNIFAYTFASPNVLKMENGTDNPGLFNIVNSNDVVPKVPVGMYDKFGTTYEFDSKESKYDNAINRVWAKEPNILEQHSLATYISYLLTQTPDGSANPYSLSSIGYKTNFSNLAQAHTVDNPNTLLKYSKKYLNGAGIDLYDFCVPGMIQGYVPQGLTYDSLHNWILISAYDKNSSGPSVIIALDNETGEFVAQFNLYQNKGGDQFTDPAKIHFGGLAASDNNLYITYYDSEIAYIPLEKLSVSKGTVKNVKISEKVDLGSLLNNAGTAYMNFDKDNNTLWVGNFYCQTAEAVLAKKTGEWDVKASKDYNTVILGYTLSGSDSQTEWNSLKSVFNSGAKYSHKVNIPNKTDGIQGVAVYNGKIFLSRAEYRPYTHNQQILFHEISLNKREITFENSDWGKVTNLPGGENIYFSNGYMYSVYEAAAYAVQGDVKWQLKDQTDVLWKTNIKDMMNGIKLGKINCPVDLEIINKDTGETVGRIVNNEVDYSISQFDTGVIVEVNGDEKSYYLPANGNYEINLTGNGTGDMDYSVISFDEEFNETDRVNYFDVPITPDTVLTGNFVSDDEIVTASDHVLSGEEIITPDEVIEGSEETFAVNISCGEGGSATESFQAVSGDYVDVNATPDSGYIFEGWYDAEDNLVSSEQNYRFCVRTDTTLKAKFSKAVTITIKTNGHGTATESFTCKAGEVFTINAIPDEGYSFVAWTDEYGMFSFSQEKKYSSLEDKEFTAYFSSKFEYSVSQITDFTVSSESGTQIAACKNGVFTTERPDIKYTTKDGSMFITSKTPVDIQGTCDTGSDIICSIKVYSDGEEVSMYLKNIAAISSDDEPGTGQKYYGFAPNGYVEYMIESDGTASLLNMCTMKDVYSSYYLIFCTAKEFGGTSVYNPKYGDTVNMTSDYEDAYWFKRFTDNEGNIKYSFVHHGKDYQITVDDTDFYYRNGMLLADYDVFPYELTISGYTPSITVGYKSTVYLMPDISINFSKLSNNGLEYVWYVNGKKATAGNDNMLLCLNELTSDTEVQFKLINADGSVAYESPVETIKVKHGFFDKLIAFFKKLFGSLPVIYQGDVKRYFFDD